MITIAAMDSDRHAALPVSPADLSWFDPSAYGPACESLLAGAGLNELGPGAPDPRSRLTLETLTLESIAAGRPIRDRAMLSCCHAALWLLHNYLDPSHCLSQEIETASGSYWHGIMHRREPDFWNSKYWFRRVGAHPVFSSLVGDARSIALQLGSPLPPEATFLVEQSRWDPLRFVDLCEASYQGRSSCTRLCQEIGQAEWRRLFDYCFRCGTEGRVTGDG